MSEFRGQTVMQNMSKFQEHCFRSIEMIKKINMKTADELRKILF